MKPTIDDYDDDDEYQKKKSKIFCKNTMPYTYTF